MTASKYRPPRRPASLEPALSRLRAMASLSADDQALIRGLGDWRSDPPGVELARGHDAPVRLLIDGWAARVRRLNDGRRQIFNFVLVGDLIGLAMPKRPGDCVTIALTAVQTVDARPLLNSVRGRPADDPLAEAFAESETVQGAWVMDQVVRLGRHSAYERMAHLILELHHRAALAGLATGARMPFPLTQEILADASGLSVVHVNRILQQLRTEHLVDIRQGHLTLTQPDHLAQLCDFRAHEISAVHRKVS